MRVGIITFQRASNYGASLQAYALSKYIESLGHECEIIDYRNQYMEKYYSAFFFEGKTFKQRIAVIANAPIRYWRKKKFEIFRKRYLVLTNDVYTNKNINKTNGIFDKFVFGSDQIWNPSLSNADKIFFGAHVVDEKKLCSYAASYGRISAYDEKLLKYKTFLSRFNNVSMREKKSAESYMILTGKYSEEVLDPVFLLDIKQWKSLAKTKNKGKYIYVYHLMGKKTEIMKAAKYLSKLTGYKIIDGQAWARKPQHNVIPKYFDDPRDFLGWIQNAEYVITDSFHCTAFSIIYRKKFWSRVENDLPFEETRVGNLLINLGLKDRIIPKLIDKWDFDLDINYEISESNLIELKEKSYAFLDKCLNK